MHAIPILDKDTGKPKIIMDYYMTIQGVDTMDQLCGAYSVARKTRLWPMAAFYALLNISGIIAQLLHFSNMGNGKYSRRIFLKNLALSFMKPYLTAAIKTLPSKISAYLSQYRAYIKSEKGGLKINKEET